MNVHCKRGFVAMLQWNLFLLLLIGINSLCTGNGPSFHLFGDEIGTPRISSSPSGRSHGSSSAGKAAGSIRHRRQLLPHNTPTWMSTC